MASSNTLHNDLFSSLISDIRTYAGRDPLLPWLRGIRKMKESLPPQLVKEKLPRFLQKCVQAFETDRRYTNDLRYLRVWLQLMDFVDDPKAVLRTMEAKRIGMKRSLFYQAYALYYEKLRKFEDAEKMYRLGVQNLAEPMDELQKSYEQFLHRMERHKNKRIQCQGGRTTNRLMSAGSIPLNCDDTKENTEATSGIKGTSRESQLKESIPKTVLNHDTKMAFAQSSENYVLMKEFKLAGDAIDLDKCEPSINLPVKNGVIGHFGCKSYFKNQEAQSTRANRTCGEDTVVVKFVDTAIVGKSDAEDARHHGLVEPTINTKEAMNAINSMFQEPLELALVGRRSSKSQPGVDQGLHNGFKVFSDENLENGFESSHKKSTEGLVPPKNSRFETNLPLQEPLQIYIDDEESNEMKQRINENDNLEPSEIQNLTQVTIISNVHANTFVFPNPHDHSSNCSKELDLERPPQSRFREDTVVYRFVGSTILDEPQVENVCHHGLVEPTINLKEAMDDINNMFGKPMEFVRKTRQKKHNKAPDRKKDCGGFLILADDNLDQEQGKFQPSSSARNDSDLFEATVCTKEAMAEINKMFGMPLDF